MLYTVGEMAKELGIPASTLRYYDQQGILPFVERSSGGIRMFTDRDYEWLKVIDCLKQSGLTIREIRDFIEMANRGDDSLEERRELFRARRDAIKRQIAELQESLDLLEFKCWYYEQALKDGTEQNVRNMPVEMLPESYRAVKQRMDITHRDK